MEKEPKESIVCVICRECGPGKLNDCHIDFMNCRVYNDLVKKLVERLREEENGQL